MGQRVKNADSVLLQTLNTQIQNLFRILWYEQSQILIWLRHSKAVTNRTFYSPKRPIIPYAYATCFESNKNTRLESNFSCSSYLFTKVQEQYAKREKTINCDFFSPRVRYGPGFLDGLDPVFLDGQIRFFLTVRSGSSPSQIKTHRYPPCTVHYAVQ